jgi:hypothetical protein
MSWCERPVVLPDEFSLLEDPVAASEIGIVSVLLMANVFVAFFALVLLDAGSICDPAESSCCFLELSRRLPFIVFWLGRALDLQIDELSSSSSS